MYVDVCMYIYICITYTYGYPPLKAFGHGSYHPFEQQAAAQLRRTMSHRLPSGARGAFELRGSAELGLLFMDLKTTIPDTEALEPQALLLGRYIAIHRCC